MTESLNARIQMYPMTFDFWYSSSMFNHLDDFEIFDCFVSLPDLDHEITQLC
jgi:hypothetical protein